LNFNRRGTKATVGLPGTGLSYSTMLKSGAPTALPLDESTGGDGTITVAVVAFVTCWRCLSLSEAGAGHWPPDGLGRADRRNTATVMSFSAVDAEFISDVFGSKGLPSPASPAGLFHARLCVAG
jgi:hypothetical protein